MIATIKKFFTSRLKKEAAVQKSTDKGYINKNHQKNLGKTELDGNHYNQKFYKMKCTLCNAEYYANGSDIWLKKCPACQNGAKSGTVTSEFVEEFAETPIGTVLTSNDIVSRIHTRYGRNKNSIIPSDYCYNRLNNGIKYETHIHLFEFLGENKYKYLGPDYAYTGKVYHKPKGEVEICVGELENGVLITDGDVLAKDRSSAAETKMTPKDVRTMHTTKREISLSLRYKVLKRDSFKCRICGASPAKDPSVELHIDHIIPWSKGGETTEDNLQTLCSKCNLGKSDSL